MGLTRDEIIEIARECAQSVLEDLHRYTVYYKEPENIADGLRESMVEESTAADWYRRRGEDARLKGDIKTAELYEHVAGEEDEHYREFQERLEMLSSNQLPIEAKLKGTSKPFDIRD